MQTFEMVVSRMTVARYLELGITLLPMYHESPGYTQLDRARMTTEAGEAPGHRAHAPASPTGPHGAIK